MDAFDEVLNDYTFTSIDGTTIDFDEKRIEAPTLIAVISGEAQMMTTGISAPITDYFVTEEILASAYSNFAQVIRLVASNSDICVQDSGC